MVTGVHLLTYISRYTPGQTRQSGLPAPCRLELEPNNYNCSAYFSGSCLDIQDLKASCLPLNHILFKAKVVQSTPYL